VCLSCNQKASLRAWRLPQLQSEGVASSVAFASAAIRRRRFERGVCLSYNQKASLRAWRLPQLQSEGVASSVAFASAAIRTRRFERGVCLSYCQKASLRAWRLPLRLRGVLDLKNATTCPRFSAF